MYRLKSLKIIDCCLKHNIIQFHGFFMHRHFFSHNTLALRVENTKWEKNLQFTPLKLLKEAMSIPTPFIWKPLGSDFFNSIMRCNVACLRGHNDKGIPWDVCGRNMPFLAKRTRIITWYNEVLDIRDGFLYPAIVKYMKKNLDITKPRQKSEQILPFPWPFVISRFNCISP